MDCKVPGITTFTQKRSKCDGLFGCGIFQVNNNWVIARRQTKEKVGFLWRMRYRGKSKTNYNLNVMPVECD